MSLLLTTVAYILYYVTHISMVSRSVKLSFHILLWDVYDTVLPSNRKHERLPLSIIACA